MHRLLHINYDLNKVGQNYEALFRSIRELGQAHKVLKSSWIVRTSLSPQQAWDRLSAVVDRNDNVLITDITNSARQGWMPQTVWDWLNGRAA